MGGRNGRIIGQTAPRCMDVTRKTAPELQAEAPDGKKGHHGVDLQGFIHTISSREGRVLIALPLATQPDSTQHSILRSVSMKIRPLHDRVIVKRLEEERVSAGGIVIPDTAAEKPVQGKVVAVGKGKILEDGNVRPLDVKVGDKILFGKYSGTEVKVDGDDLVVMREEDVMAVIEGK
jgi:chaperonin GroES